MAKKLNTLSGIGDYTAAILEKNGFASVEELASATVNELTKVPGFGSIRARKIIDLAKQHLKDSAPKPKKKEKKGKKAKAPVKKAEKKKEKRKEKKGKKKKAEEKNTKKKEKGKKKKKKK